VFIFTKKIAKIFAFGPKYFGTRPNVETTRRYTSLFYQANKGDAPAWLVGL